MLWWELWGKRYRAEDGVVTAWIVIAMPVMLFFAFGLTWDVGGALLARADAWDVASATARAGAAQSIQEGPPGLDSAVALSVAYEYLGQHPDVGGSVQIDGETVVVDTVVSYDAVFFPGLSWSYTANATAEAQIGIRGPSDAG